MFMVHPTPLDDAQAALWAWLANNELKAPDTWEVACRAARTSARAFTRLLLEEKLGYLALLRNLRNMAGPASIRRWCSAQFSPAGRRTMLPFRYIAAVRAAPQFASQLNTAPARVRSTLAEAASRTVVLVDVSGSMDMQLSSKSDLRRIDAAAALASVINGDSVRTFVYANNAVEVPTYQGLPGVDQIGAEVGGGTDLARGIQAVDKTRVRSPDRHHRRAGADVPDAVAEGAGRALLPDQRRQRAERGWVRGTVDPPRRVQRACHPLDCSAGGSRLTRPAVSPDVAPKPPGLRGFSLRVTEPTMGRPTTIERPVMRIFLCLIPSILLGRAGVGLPSSISGASTTPGGVSVGARSPSDGVHPDQHHLPALGGRTSVFSALSGVRRTSALTAAARSSPFRRAPSKPIRRRRWCQGSVLRAGRLAAVCTGENGEEFFVIRGYDGFRRTVGPHRSGSVGVGQRVRVPQTRRRGACPQPCTLHLRVRADLALPRFRSVIPIYTGKAAQGGAIPSRASARSGPCHGACRHRHHHRSRRLPRDRRGYHRIHHRRADCGADVPRQGAEPLETMWGISTLAGVAFSPAMFDYLSIPGLRRRRHAGAPPVIRAVSRSCWRCRPG